MKVKQCRICRVDFPLDCFYVGTCGDGKSSWCKHCAKAKVRAAREFKKQMGIPANVPMADVIGDNGYVDRHLQRREQESQLRESLEPEPESFADIRFNSLDPEPVFRNLVPTFLRKQQRTFSWKTF